MHRNRPPPEIFTSDFFTMHSKCNALTYKVHSPVACSCVKMHHIRAAVVSDPLDGLVVLPDKEKNTFGGPSRQRHNAIYLCLGTGMKEFQKDPKQAEQKLRDEIFPASKAQVADFKLSCAGCLLLHNPNGFACVSSPSLTTIENVRDVARRAAVKKMLNDLQLKEDHADFLCIMKRDIMWELKTATTIEKKESARRTIMESLAPQIGGGEYCSDEDQVEIAHHLVSLLKLTRRNTSASTSNYYWLAILWDDRGKGKKNCWTLDLTGGKRHLGESSFECAIRETDDECSLDGIDVSWIVGKPFNERMASNIYYMLRPPDATMKGLEEMIDGLTIRS